MEKDKFEFFDTDKVELRVSILNQNLLKKIDFKLVYGKQFVFDRA